MSQQVDFKQLKQQVSITDILTHYSLTDGFRSKGDHQLVGPCPFSTSPTDLISTSRESFINHHFTLKPWSGGNWNRHNLLF